LNLRVIIIFLLVSLQCFAKTSLESTVTGAAFGTLWGGVHRAIDWPSTRGELIELNLKGLKGPLKVYISKQDKPSDLIVYYPGVFGRAEGKISKHAIKALETKNAHVVFLPNLLAADYLKVRPQTKSDALKVERLYQREMFFEVLNYIGKKNITKIHLIAESLGSLQLLFTFNPEDFKQLSVKNVILLWPPLKIHNSVKRFDKLIHDSLITEKTCTYWWKWPLYFWEIRVKDSPDGLSDLDKKCLGAWGITSGFVKMINKTSKEVFDHQEKNHDELPSTFYDFMRVVTPEIFKVINSSQEGLTLNTLLGPFKNQFQRFKIYSSENDFLNSLNEWEELKKNYPEISNNIYLFKWGGHSGPIGRPGFFYEVIKEI
jgi:hypothetical protein